MMHFMITACSIAAQQQLKERAMLRTFLLLSVCTAVLGGCATRGALTMNCPEFRTNFVHTVPDPEIIRVIHDPRSIRQQTLQYSGQIFSASDIDRYLQSPDGQQLQKRMIETAVSQMAFSKAFQLPSSNDEPQPPQYQQPVVLLLSGGGQWGSFGASFLQQIHASNPNNMPDFTVITGVSTGSLQAFYLAAGQASGNKTKWLAELRRQYSPQNENEIVDRNGMAGAVFSGSVAGLQPLRKRIEDSLCQSDGKGGLKCDLIEELAKNSAPNVLIGFVEANSGAMQFVDAKDIAQSKLSNIEKQQCLTGAAMSSVAMPFYFQQVRVASKEPDSAPEVISERTYYDGGVRQSVFFAFVDGVVKGIIAPSRSEGTDKSSIDPPRTIFMLRNGPTIARRDDAPDNKADALTSALRGYQLLVNQSEVTSLAAVRPLFPAADIYLATADHYGQSFTDPAPEQDRPAQYPNGCVKQEKRKDMMFDPEFMSCLRAYGRAKAKAGSTDSWIKIP
jgi:predicted acylesterase/phospholipase RssA